MSHYEDLNTTKIALAGFIATVAVFAIILLVMVLFHLEMAKLDQSKVIDQPAAEYASLTAEQLGQLASYRWIDKDKRIVQIPIKQAMGLVLEELQKSSDGKPAPQSAPQESPPEKEGEHGS